MVVDHREPRLRFQVCAQGEAFAGHPALWLSLVRWRAHKGSSAARLPCDGQAQSKRRVHRHRRRHGSRKRSEEHTSELQSPYDLVCRLLLEKKKKQLISILPITKSHK